MKLKNHCNKTLGVVFFLSFLILATSVSCGSGTKEAEVDSSGGIVKVFVSILPQKRFVERVGGDRVQVDVMVLPGKNPATYEPTPRQMVALGEADLFFSQGVAFEKAFLPAVRKSLPGITLVATDEGVEKRYLESHSHEDEQGHEAEHDEDHLEEPDPHIWMDPQLVKIQAARIRDALIMQDPAGAEVYRNNYISLEQDLTGLDQELESLLTPFAGDTLFVYHPAFGYFCDRYGLVQVAIETGGREPTPAQLEGVIEKAQEEGVKVLFVQPEFPEKSARAVANAIHGAVIPVAPLAENYFDSLRELGKAVAEGLAK